MGASIVHDTQGTIFHFLVSESKGNPLRTAPSSGVPDVRTHVLILSSVALYDSIGIGSVLSGLSDVN